MVLLSSLKGSFRNQKWYFNGITTFGTLLVLKVLLETIDVFRFFLSCQWDASCCRQYHQAAVGAFTILSILFRVSLFCSRLLFNRGQISVACVSSSANSLVWQPHIRRSQIELVTVPCSCSAHIAGKKSLSGCSLCYIFYRNVDICQSTTLNAHALKAGWNLIGCQFFFFVSWKKVFLKVIPMVSFLCTINIIVVVSL